MDSAGGQLGGTGQATEEPFRLREGVLEVVGGSRLRELCRSGVAAPLLFVPDRVAKRGSGSSCSAAASAVNVRGAAALHPDAACACAVPAVLVGWRLRELHANACGRPCKGRNWRRSVRDGITELLA